MRRLVGAFVLATLLTSCGLAADAPSSSSAAPSALGLTATPEARILLARPLKLPVLQPDSTCPVTPVSSRKLEISDPRGAGPLYLGGPMPQGGFPWNKTVWVLVDGAHGPVLFRGGRVDGAGALRLSGSPPDSSDQGIAQSSAGGVSATFFQRVIVEGVADAFYVYPASIGCYALQVDGTSFQEVIVFSAT